MLRDGLEEFRGFFNIFRIAFIVACYFLAVRFKLQVFFLDFFHQSFGKFKDLDFAFRGTPCYPGNALLFYLFVFVQHAQLTDAEKWMTGQSKTFRLASSNHHVPSVDEHLKFSLLLFAQALPPQILENRKSLFSVLCHPIYSVVPPLQKKDLPISILQKI